MEITDCIELFMQDRVPPEILSRPLPDALAPGVVDHLKNEADRYWFIDPTRSLELADRIIAIGEARGDASQKAMGLMAKGDALRFLGHSEQAWGLLEEAGELFEGDDNEVGWARTRIGRLDLGIKLKRVPETLQDAERAREIFVRRGEAERLLRLEFQTAIVHNFLGDQRRALQLLRSALDLVPLLGETGKRYYGQLYLNIGYTYEALNDLGKALAYYERARSYMVEAREARNIALLDTNIAYIARSQGQYRRALDTLHRVLSGIGQFPLEELGAQSDMVECYLYLNRYNEARDLAREVIDKYRVHTDAYELGRSLLHLAAAEAGLANFPAAQEALDEAEPLFDSLGATRWIMTTHVWRGKMALRQGDAETARREALSAAARFETGGQQAGYASANLLEGQALLALGDFEEAARSASRGLQIAQQQGLPALRYSTHLLLGQVREGEGRPGRAVRHYEAAAAVVEHVQRGLSITLRPGFLEDKGEALRSLIALQLRAGRTEKAFGSLERAKSQVLLGYLANRENLIWNRQDPRSRELIERLDQLRAEHQWYYRLAHNAPRPGEHPGSLQPEEAAAEVARREREMRLITEQLYLHGENTPEQQSMTTSLSAIQRSLEEGTLLLEFYNDGSGMWAFTLDGKSVEVTKLPITVAELDLLLAQLQSNVSAVLLMDPQAQPARWLGRSAVRVLQRLYGDLLGPLGLDQRKPQRLVIVPYGALHYLPFHLLHDGSCYLIERCEVVILPAAGLASRQGPRREPGALILANSWEGRLPQTLAEAQIVQRLFHGELHTEEQASRDVLQASSAQILHIAAHGEFRLDQPDLSYLQLADGQLYADDLLQQNLGYELVTLSGCETGRANVTAGDELIGLGRGLLYAGAGAVMTSLWRVADLSTMEFMERTYTALREGASKAAAIRAAQQAMLNEDRELHPAFWGAFQLIGDAHPLSNERTG